MNKQLLATAVAGAIAPMAAQALDISVSGHVNRAIRFADNGVNSDVQHIDGSASKSRFRFTAEGEAMPGITAGAHIEYGSSNNPGGSLDVENPDDKASFDARHSLLYFSGDFGKITMGNAPSAGNGIMWTSHNGAWMGTEYSPDTNSGLGVMQTDGMASGYSVFSFFPSVNTPRMNTLRYDTPSIGPISLSASIQKEDDTTHDLHFDTSRDHDGLIVFCGLRRCPPPPCCRRCREPWIFFINPTGFVLGPAELGLHLDLTEHFIEGEDHLGIAAWGSDDSGGQDYEDMYINVAHSWGNMNVALDYPSTENGTDVEGRATGLGAQYSLGGGVDVYAGFNSYSFDHTMDLEDFNAFHMGSRVNFAG